MVNNIFAGMYANDFNLKITTVNKISNNLGLRSFARLPWEKDINANPMWTNRHTFQISRTSDYLCVGNVVLQRFDINIYLQTLDSNSTMRAMIDFCKTIKMFQMWIS